jgi:hypothetical protein
MNCLDNLIGINNQCTPTTPSSGLYIQNLPGITLKVANAANNEETESGVKLLQDIISFSQNKILAQVRNQLQSKIQTASVLENDTIGFYKENLKSVALEAGKYKGIKARIDKFPSLDLFISKIYLKLSQAVTTNIYVIDLMTGTILDTLPITTVDNIPTAIIVNKSYPTNSQRTSLFICIDSSVSNTFEATLSGKGDCYSCYSDGYSNRFISFTGAKLDQAAQKIDSNISSNSGTNGLSIEYSLNCSVESFICNMAGQLAWPMLHDVGAELMRRLKYTDRLNSIVTINAKNNEDLRAEFEAEYFSSMSALLENIKMPNDICFKCNSRVKRVSQIP